MTENTASQPRPQRPDQYSPEWCPPGLEQLCASKMIKFSKDTSFFGTSGKFIIKNEHDQLLLLAESEGSMLCTNEITYVTCNLPNGGHTALFVNNTRGQMAVESPSGTVIGYMTSPSFCCDNQVVGFDRKRSPVIIVNCDSCGGCCGETSHSVSSPKYSNIMFPPIDKSRNTFSQDRLKITFPDGINNLTKIMLFAASFITDFFEEAQSRN